MERTQDVKRSLEVANTIQAQIGYKTMFMLGAKDIYALENGLQFRIRGSQKANKVRVILTPADTYNVEFWKIRGLSSEKVSEVEDIYAESLHSVIEEHTGLYTSL